MSRYTITLRQGERRDAEAVLGFDPPLLTFFLQGFVFEVDDYVDFEIWLGTSPGEFTTLEALVEAARGQGYEMEGLAPSTIIKLLKECTAASSRIVAGKFGFR